VDILTLEAALNQNNLSLLNANGGGGVLLLNQPQSGNTVPIIYGTGIFDNHQPQHTCVNSNSHNDNGTYETSEMNEQEPMLTSHYASSGIMLNNNNNKANHQQEEKQEESQQLL
jgi:Zn-dependent M28 family amino/carboxypeptidase